MHPRTLTLKLLLIGLASGSASSIYAASVYIAPAAALRSSSFLGDVQFELFMDFDASDPTLGGGIDIKLDPALSIVGFTPSPYFSTQTDSAFSGAGTANADHAYEIHFGSFGGLSGVNRLGTLTVNLSQPLSAIPTRTAAIDLLINQHFGDFYSAATFDAQVVSLGGASISAVPEANMAWTMLSGLGLLGVATRRRRRASLRS